MDNLFASLKRFDLRDLLRLRGVELDSSDYVHAPWRNERTASVKIYVDHFHDYGDEEKHGDYLDWLELAYGFSKEDARREATQLLQRLGADVSAPRVSKTGNRPKRSPQASDMTWLPSFVVEAHDALVRGR